MTSYILMILMLITIGIFLKPTKSIQRKKIYLMVAFIVLVVISGFRAYSVGADTSTYVSLFSLVDRIDIFNGRFEVGFMSYLKVLSFFSEDPGLLLIVSSCISIGCVCFFIYHHSDDPVLSILLYVLLRAYFIQMNSMRQALATGIVLLAIHLLLKNRKIVAVLLILLAVSVHTIAIIAFIPYMVWIFLRESVVKRLNAKNCVKWTIVLSIGVFAFYEVIVRIVNFILPQYSAYFFSTWSDSNYFASVLNLLIQCIFLFIGAIYLWEKKLEQEEKLAAIMLIGSIVFSTLAIRMEIWSRISDMFNIYTAIIWAPAFVSNIKNGRDRFLIRNIIIICAFIYLFVILSFRPEWDQVVPYQFR